MALMGMARDEMHRVAVESVEDVAGIGELALELVACGDGIEYRSVHRHDDGSRFVDISQIFGEPAELLGHQALDIVAARCTVVVAAVDVVENDIVNTADII